MLNTINPCLINDEDQSPTESTLLHPYPGSMPAFLASRLIEQYSKKGDIIFDPFCGSGSVLTEALRLKRNCIGSDLLDLSVSIAKTAINLPEPKEITMAWERIRETALCDVSLFSNVPLNTTISVNIEKLKEWLHPETLAGVLSIRNQVDIKSNNKSENIIALILASSLLSLSKRVSRGVLHWGWIADNVVPKAHDLYMVNPFNEVDRRIRRLINFVEAIGGGNLKDNLFCEIRTINWLDYNEEFTNKKVNLLITSPPYPYSIDYTLAQRLTYYLFDKEFDDLRGNEIGARYKRKRKNRAHEYLDEIRLSLNNSSKHVEIGGKTVFVLPHPDEYQKILNLSEDEWLDFINNSLNGNWELQEYGVRDCVQRRVVNSSASIRREIVMVSSRKE